MTYQYIKTRMEHDIAVLTFNRPKTLNAFNKDMIGEINAVMKAWGTDPKVNAIVVHGEGRAFSAGFDLKVSAERNSTAHEIWKPALDMDFDFIMQFWDCPKPIVSAIHGFAIAGALELALCCDVTVAAEGTILGEPEVKFGSGMVVLLLPWIMPGKLAREILLTGEDQLDARRGYEMGIINHVVPAGQELAKAMEIAEKMASAAPLSVQMTKRAINRTYEAMGMRQALLAALDVDLLIGTWGQPERAEFNRITNEKGLKAALDWRNSKRAAAKAAPAAG